MAGPEMASRTPESLKRWIDSVGGATLPLLAGFSTTSVVVVSDDAVNFRWPGAAILAFTIAAVVLIIAVQCAYHARIYLSELTDQKDQEVSPVSTRDVNGRQQDHDHYELGLNWTNWTQRSYHTGIVALLIGLALAVAPYHATGVGAGFQWLATGLAFAASVGEAAAWTVWQHFKS